MAIIGKIRTKFGVVVSIVIGLSLLGFLLMSALNSESSLFRSRNTTIAKVNGSSIDYNDFATIENRNTEQYELFNQSGKAIDEQARQNIREQSWTELLQNNIMEKKYDQLGIAVSNEEMQQQLAGNNPHAVIKQQFSDPKTGAFSPANITRFLNSDVYKNNQENWQRRWFFIEEYVKKDRYTNKFNKLISKAFYIPTWMAEMDYKEKNDKVNFQFAYVPYSKIADDQVKPTDAEVKEYAEKHGKQFQKEEEERKIEFVSFDLIPSAADNEAARKSLEVLIDSFQHTKNDSLMVAANSETDVDGKFYAKDKMPSMMKDTFFKKPIKAVVGPYIEGGFVKLSKITNRKPMPDSVKASHILLAVKEGADTSSANRRMDSIMMAIKKGASFAALAKQYSQDPGSKDKGGDLGYFPAGRMVPTFDEACFNGKKGDIKKVVSQFGIHLIQIVDQKGVNNAVQVFTIAKSLRPSRATEQAVTNQANDFASKNNTAADFDAAAKDHKREAAGIKHNDAMINGINGNAREMIKSFVFAEDTKLGSVSPVFTIENKLIVAKLVSLIEKGKIDMDAYRNTFELEIKKQKRFDIISKDIVAKIAGKATLAEAAVAIGDTAHSAKNISMSQPFLPIGYEPKIVGAAFGLKNGVVSKPISGNAGVFILMVENVQAAAAPTDLNTNKSTLAGQYGQGVEYRLFSETKKHLNIDDYRSNFY